MYKLVFATLAAVTATAALAVPPLPAGTPPYASLHGDPVAGKAAFGVCKTCHAVDPKNIGPNGKPRLNFADDSKKEKQTARQMVKMTEGINANYIAKIDSSGAPVTCGTCHRGHFGPEPFVAPKEKEGPH